MFVIQFFTIADLVIMSLTMALLFSFLYIFKLRHLLKYEKNKKLVPVLMLEIDEQGRGIYVKNEGTFAAKDIKVEDLFLTLDYDFKKSLIFKFEPIDVLNPGKAENLGFKIYDGEYRIAGEEFDNILGRLSRDSFEMRMTFTNLENVRFSEVFIKEKDETLVKEVIPC